MRARQDFNSRMDRIMIPVMIAIVCGLFVTIIGMMIYQPLYIEGKISKEQWLKIFRILNLIMGGSIISPLFIAFISGAKLYIDDLKFQALQAGLDTFDGPIVMSPYNIYKYQIQTLPGGANDIRITKNMIAKIRSTRSYKTLLIYAKTGNGILDIDSTDLFKQIDEDLAILSKKEKLKFQSIGDIEFEETMEEETENVFADKGEINEPTDIADDILQLDPIEKEQFEQECVEIRKHISFFDKLKFIEEEQPVYIDLHKLRLEYKQIELESNKICEEINDVIKT